MNSNPGIPRTLDSGEMEEQCLPPNSISLVHHTYLGVALIHQSGGCVPVSLVNVVRGQGADPGTPIVVLLENVQVRWVACGEIQLGGTAFH